MSLLYSLGYWIQKPVGLMGYSLPVSSNRYHVYPLKDSAVSCDQLVSSLINAGQERICHDSEGSKQCRRN